MRKAQTEIIGVVIIVIMLVVGGIFWLTLRAGSQDTSAKGIQDPEAAHSFLNAIMNTKTEKGKIVYDIIKDCYGINCGTSPSQVCCDDAQKVLTNALDATLKAWNMDYELTVVREGTGSKIGPIKNGKCDDYSTEVHQSFYAIPPPPPIIVTLKICR